MFFAVSGIGIHAGADAIHAKWQKRKLKVSIIGLSDIVYNDILLMDKTFGVDTAVKAAQRATNFAYIKADFAFHSIS